MRNSLHLPVSLTSPNIKIETRLYNGKIPVLKDLLVSIVGYLFGKKEIMADNSIDSSNVLNRKV